MTRRGQSLLELIIAIGVVTTTTVAAVTLIVRTMSVGQESRNKTEAVNYAREGVEVIRMLRDSNWLRIDQNIIDDTDITQWDDSGRSAGYQRFGGTGTAYYYLNFTPTYGWRAFNCPNVSGNTTCTAASNSHYRNINLVTNSGATYASQENTCPAATCTPTAYRRIIQITRCTETVVLAGTNTTLPCLDVVSTVFWTSGGLAKQLRVGTRLYNWK